MPGIKQTHCRKGHPLLNDNVYRKKDGTVQCRICHAVRKHEYYIKHKADCIAYSKEYNRNRRLEAKQKYKPDSQLDEIALNWLKEIGAGR